MRIIKSLLYLLSSILFSCSSGEEEIYRISFSQPITDKWREAMNNEVQREQLFHEDMEVIFKDAGGDSEKQIQQIQELINEGINLLIVSPNESEAVRQVIERVFRKGIPVILLDRKINSNEYTAYVGADNQRIGREAAKYIAGVLNGSGKILATYENLISLHFM